MLRVFLHWCRGCRVDSELCGEPFGGISVVTFFQTACVVAILLVILVVGLTVWLTFRPKKPTPLDLVRQRRDERDKARVAEHSSLKAIRAEGGSDISVVGESNYWSNLNHVSGADEHGARRRNLTAWLLAEPENQHDRNAVQVVIEDRVVGYLSRAKAEKYQPLVLRAAGSGYRITCSAYVDGGWTDDDGDIKDFGVTISLMAPKALESLLDKRLG